MSLNLQPPPKLPAIFNAEFRDFVDKWYVGELCDIPPSSGRRVQHIVICLLPLQLDQEPSRESGPEAADGECACSAVCPAHFNITRFLRCILSSNIPRQSRWILLGGFAAPSASISLEPPPMGQRCEIMKLCSQSSLDLYYAENGCGVLIASVLNCYKAMTTLYCSSSASGLPKKAMFLYWCNHLRSYCVLRVLYRALALQMQDFDLCEIVSCNLKSCIFCWIFCNFCFSWFGPFTGLSASEFCSIQFKLCIMIKFTFCPCVQTQLPVMCNVKLKKKKKNTSDLIM